MANKQSNGVYAPDGSYYVTLTNGAGELTPVVIENVDVSEIVGMATEEKQDDILTLLGEIKTVLETIATNTTPE